MGFKLGLDCKLYRNTGTWGSPTWAEVGNARDVTVNLERGEADLTTRANAGWRATVGTLKDASLEFEMVWDPGDAGFAAVRDAFLNGTVLDMVALDGGIAVSGSQGLRAEFSILSFSRSEPLEEGVTVNVTAKPAYSENAPEWMTVT
ncbi:MAG: hypothetical protein AMXMBFR77_26870 [Phycisphaerales bacterium]